MSSETQHFTYNTQSDTKTPSHISMLIQGKSGYAHSLPETVLPSPSVQHPVISCKGVHRGDVELLEANCQRWLKMPAFYISLN